LPGKVEGVVLSISLDPAQMLADQDMCLRRMERAVRQELMGESVDVVGLGALCAVVGARGEALAERLSMPVTTGNAATAWALWQNARDLAAELPGPIAVIGAGSPVGNVLCALLAEEGLELQIDARRPPRGVAARSCASPEEAARGCRLVIGCGPTGGTLDPAALRPGAVVLDVAIPGTVREPMPPGLRLLAGEALSMPPDYRRDIWGQLYHLLAGYGPWLAFACLIEPMVMAWQRRSRPFALGRRLEAGDVRAFGEGAAQLGFAPRLARGWWPVEARPGRLERWMLGGPPSALTAEAP
jgi:predicted amino acid dehydrogenase